MTRRISSLFLLAAAGGRLVGAIRKVGDIGRVGTSAGGPFDLSSAKDDFESNGLCALANEGSMWTETSPAYTIRFGSATVNVELDTSSDVGLNIRDTLGGEADNFVGTHATEDFKHTLCTDDVKKVFPNACEFFKSKNLALTCAHLAAAIKAPKVGRAVADAAVVAGGHAADGARVAGRAAADAARVAGGHAADGARVAGRAAANEVGRAAEQTSEWYDEQTLAFETSEKGDMEVSGWSCGVSTWSQTVAGMKIEVGASESSVTSEDGKGDTPDGFPDDLEGSFTTTEFKKKVCSEDVVAIFPRACNFLTAGGLALACPHVSAAIYSDEKKNKVKDWYNAAPLSFMSAGPLASMNLVVQDSGRCWPKDWSQKLLVEGEFAVKISIAAKTSSVVVESKFQDDFNNALPDFAGEYTTTEFKKKVCEPAAMASFPYACDFLHESNGLTLSCPLIAAAIKGAEGLSKFGNALAGLGLPR